MFSYKTWYLQVLNTFFVVFQSLSHVQTLLPHGLQHPRLHCTSVSPKVALIHVHCVGDANYLMLCCTFLLLPSILPSIRVSPMSRLFASGGQSIGASASASVLPVNIHRWFLLGLTDLSSLQSKGLSRVFSSTTVRKHQFFVIQPSI